MSFKEKKKQILYDMTKDQMDEIGLTYTDEQARKMADFVGGVVLLSKEIQKDIMISKIKEM